jgi:hypothetical protein
LRYSDNKLFEQKINFKRLSQITFLLNEKIEKIEKRNFPEHAALNIIPDFDEIDLLN